MDAAVVAVFVSGGQQLFKLKKKAAKSVLVGNMSHLTPDWFVNSEKRRGA